MATIYRMLKISNASYSEFRHCVEIFDFFTKKFMIPSHFRSHLYYTYVVRKRKEEIQLWIKY